MQDEEMPQILIAAKDIDQAIDALEFSVELLERSSQDQRFWRWAILSLHQAAQGFMVCALAGSNGTRPLNHRRKDILRYIQELRAYSTTGKDPEMPPNALDTFPSLYEKVKDPNMMRQYGHSRPFKIPAQCDEFDTHIRDLNNYRNKFQHFTPNILWVVDLACFVEPAKAALRLVDFLAFESGNILWQAYPGNRDAKVRSLLDNGQRAVEKLARQCGIKYGTPEVEA